MAVSVRVTDDIASIGMSGRFNFQVHREFKDAYTQVLANAAIREIEIEMSKLDYLDSSALGMLMLLRERAQAGGKTVRISNPSAAVMQILDIANFGKLFKIT